MSYLELKSKSPDLSLIALLDFLGKLRNARLRPGSVDDDLPPMLFWWFEEEDREVNQFIVDAVHNFPWQEEWVIETVGNEKWLLFPKRTLEVEKKLQGIDGDHIEITTNSSIWLMKNDPDFGRRANKDLDRFRKYFRRQIEEYLRKKEGL